MSALGQKQTYAAHKWMSALPPKADMCSATRDVRFVPIANMAYVSAMSALPRRFIDRSPGIGMLAIPKCSVTRLCVSTAAAVKK